MKRRKPNETDAEYIARLELAYAEKSKTNERWRKDWKRVMGHLIPAADMAGLVLQTAAEITGTKDDPEVIRSIEGLRALASCVWHDDEVVVPPLPNMPVPKPEFGGDAEMILKSALEKVKQSRPPWESWTDIVPQYNGVDPATLDWEGIANEVYDALCDLEMSRGLLRLDLRSTMYDHCFQRISSALREASHRAVDDRMQEYGQNQPTSADEMIPF